MNLIDYLESKELDVHYPGEKNVTRGWVNIQCPFPECADPSWHCGINQSILMFNCYVCGEKGSIAKLIRQIEHCSWERAEIITNQLDEGFEELKRDIRVRHNDNILPKEAKDEMPDAHRNYLLSRRHDPDELAKKYNLKFCYNIGDWRFRVIIPIYLDGNLISFTSYSVTGMEPIKKHCPNDMAIVPAKQCLYNLDSVNDTAVIVEGVTDVWRIGDGAVGTFGDNYTTEQLALLNEKKIRRAVVMYDSHAGGQAVRLASQLSGFIPLVEVYELPDWSDGTERDPDDLTDEEVIELREEIFT